MPAIGLGIGVAYSRAVPVTAPPPVPDGVLDTLSVPAVAAYGARRLRNDYSGAAFRVRRSPGGAALNVGFTPQGDLNVAFLQSFIGSATGYIEAWYDQSGNGLDLVQAFEPAQPRIVDAGVLELASEQSDRPGARFFGGQYLTGAPVLLDASEFSVGVVSREMLRTQSIGWLMSTGAAVQASMPWSNGAVYFDVGGSLGNDRVEFRPAPEVETPGAYLFENSLVGLTKRIFLNDAEKVIGVGTTGPVDTLEVGGKPGEAIDAVFGEFLVFAEALGVVDRVALLANQDAYYGLIASEESP